MAQSPLDEANETFFEGVLQQFTLTAIPVTTGTRPAPAIGRPVRNRILGTPPSKPSIDESDAHPIE